MKGKKILLAYRGNFVSCPRPKRLYLHLRNENQVDICSLDTNSIEGVKSFPIIKKSMSPFSRLLKKICIKFKLDRWVSYSAALDCELAISREQMNEYDWIFVHDLALLPFFVHCSNKVIFDAREYYPRQYGATNEWQQQLLDVYDYYCKSLLSKIPRKITVSQGIADEYKKYYDADFKVFKSFPVQDVIDSGKTIEIDNSKINLIHHGGCLPNRSMEKLIEFGGRLGSDYHLYLMLVWLDEKYYRSICALAEKYENITIIEPVGFQEIIPFISQFDIGIHFLEDLEGQHAVSLPNKFFEFVAAGLMLLVTGSQEMITETRQHKLGLAYDGVSDLGRLEEDLKGLSKQQINQYRENARATAPNYDFGKQFETLVDELALH
ncbi:hypothetical protein [Alteromonas facilis]|uniref:hypothetical protein n=1 Tax=Alteromonas facilis TaxID=2048004 RepID=UPI000C289218|nr:hypothetical protein [Alteromonas facilis]